MKRRRYTLKGRIGSRPDTLPVKTTLAIGIYVIGCVGGWTLIGILITLVVQS